MQYVIRNERLTVTVDSLGAEPVSVRLNGRERLWQNDNGGWAGHAPVLFPVCGHFAVTVNGVKYPMRAHGFARKKEFELADRGEDFIEFVLRDDGETRKVYPYPFTLSVRYGLRGSVLAVSYRVTNTGGGELVFSCGGHPSFALADGVENYCLEFEREEELVHLPHNEDGYLTGERVLFGTHKRFDLPAEYLQNGDTLIFGNVCSRKVTLLHRSGEKVASLNFEDFPHLLLWRPHGANMICIEPWRNLPDLKQDDDAEFSAKSGVSILPAQKSQTLSFEIQYD